MKPGMSGEHADFEALASLVRLHAGEDVYTAFHQWTRTVPNTRRLAFFRDLRRNCLDATVPLQAAQRPDAGELKRKSEQVLAYSAIALWHIYELRDMTRRA